MDLMAACDVLSVAILMLSNQPTFSDPYFLCLHWRQKGKAAATFSLPPRVSPSHIVPEMQSSTLLWVDLLQK